MSRSLSDGQRLDTRVEKGSCPALEIVMPEASPHLGHPGLLVFTIEMEGVPECVRHTSYVIGIDDYCLGQLPRRTCEQGEMSAQYLREFSRPV